ncbi:hypothetical protein ACQKOF_04575 [Lysinibacillus sp. NPDC093190]
MCESAATATDDFCAKAQRQQQMIFCAKAQRQQQRDAGQLAVIA